MDKVWRDGGGGGEDLYEFFFFFFKLSTFRFFFLQEGLVCAERM